MLRNPTLALAVVFASSALPAQRAAPPAAPKVPPELEALRDLPWRSLGPVNQAGRISVVVGVPGDPDTYFVGAANGGIIRTTNGGTTFKPVFDSQSASSIGAIAIAPSDRNVIYVGTGEGNPRNNASIGDGMYKSVDGGEHWTRIGLEKSDKVARIVIDPRNPDIVFACVLGREWGPSEERGVFKTTDGGRTWRKVLYVDAQTSCSDISSAANNGNVLFAGMYTYRRWAWHLESGGGNTAVYRSTDGGESWERLSGPDRALGLPKKAMDRIGVAVAPGNPGIVYVISETVDEGELWRSDDGGDHWRMVNRDPNINFRPFYYADIRVDPANPNKVYALSGALWMSEDGGTTFRTIARDVHGDHQAMWIDPLNANRVLSGSDGGWQVSFDGAKTFEIVNTFPFTQFYHVNYDLQKPYMVCGGLQDNGNWCGPSQNTSPRGIRKPDWFTVSGGDGFFTVPDLRQPWLIYSNAQGGMINLTDIRTGAQKTIYPYPNRVGSVGDAMIGHKYRFNWNAPIALSPQDPGTVYFGGNVLFRSRTHGMSWEVISPDLTTNDPRKQQSSGGPIVVDNTAAEFHSTLLSIAPSPLDSNLIWISTDDGNVQVTRDGGKSWSNVFVNVPGLKPNAWLPTIEASQVEPGTAYVAADHHQDDDYAPYAFMTTDYGRTWKSITGDLPQGAGWVHVVREDPRNRNLLYLGAEMGLFASWDRGAHWVSLRGKLPVVQVRDLHVHPRENDIILATHGRGLYIWDDATALQQIRPAMATDATLFDLRPAVRWSMWNRDGNLGQKQWGAQNPPPGALITYYLKVQPKGPVNVTIRDSAGKVVRVLRRVPDEPGVNRVNWDLRAEAPFQVPGAQVANQAGGVPAAAPDTSLNAVRERRRAAATGDRDVPGEFEGFGGPVAPMVLAGTYTVALTVDGRTLTKSVVVENDPRSDMTPQQLAAQYETAIVLRDLASSVNRLVVNTDDLSRQATNLRDQLTRAQRAVARDSAKHAPVLALLDTTLRELKHFRDSVLMRPLPGLGYRQYPRLREEVQSVQGMVARPMMPPTAGELLRLTELEAETTEARGRLNSIVATRIARINAMLQGQQHILAPAPDFVP